MSVSKSSKIQVPATIIIGSRFRCFEGLAIATDYKDLRVQEWPSSNETQSPNQNSLSQMQHGEYSEYPMGLSTPEISGNSEEQGLDSPLLRLDQLSPQSPFAQEAHQSISVGFQAQPAIQVRCLPLKLLLSSTPSHLSSTASVIMCHWIITALDPYSYHDIREPYGKRAPVSTCQGNSCFYFEFLLAK